MTQKDPFSPPPGSQSIDDILAEARSHLTRITPHQALAYIQATSKPTPTSASSPPVLLIDIRPALQRSQQGQVEGATIIERNVLEWRLDPRSDARLDIANRYDLRAIVMCQEGYTSSLAAKALQDLGLWNATDVEGGFRAWREAGLPETIVGLGKD